MTRRSLSASRLLAGFLTLVGALPVLAQDMARDPTVAPSDSRSATPLPPGMDGMAVLVRNGKPFVMVSSRLYAVGDRVGKLRVDRITEREVWFHDGVSQIKIPRFTGIERKAAAGSERCAAAPASTPAAAASATAKSKAKRRVPVPPTGTAAHNATPCEDAQP